jgi:hypothetical protein
MQHKYISSLRVVDADGVDKKDGLGNVIPVQGTIVLESGANMNVAADDSGGIAITAGYGLTPPSPEMLAKWNEVINGSFSVADPQFDFSGTNPNFYYFTKLNGVGTIDSYAFLNVDRCYHVGQFLDNSNPEAASNTLSILDTCPACVDCPEFDTIQTYLDTIVKNPNNPPVSYDGQKNVLLDEKAMLDKYMSMIAMWNYIVNYRSWRYNAEAKGPEVYASCKYTNHTNDAIPPGLRMTIDFTNTPPRSKAFFIDTAVIGGTGTFTRSDFIVNKLSSLKVQLETTKALPIGGGIRFYCGSLSPYYTGANTRAQVHFQLDFVAGGIGNRSTTFNSNLMVAIDPSADPTWDDDSSSGS